jgi:serine/threonine protein kinase
MKPENMLLGENGQLLLSDFGIALVAQSTRYQSTQEVVGTAAYMAPEQLQGKPRRASDQYALAIVVYEWICGDRPMAPSLRSTASICLCHRHPCARRFQNFHLPSRKWCAWRSPKNQSDDLPVCRHLRPPWNKPANERPHKRAFFPQTAFSRATLRSHSKRWQLSHRLHCRRR